MSISKESLNIIACPKCKGKIEADEGKNAIVCSECRLSYPLRDDIPVMLIDEADSF